jgi:hypothetical protein
MRRFRASAAATIRLIAAELSRTRIVSPLLPSFCVLILDQADSPPDPFCNWSDHPVPATAVAVRINPLRQ